MGRYREPRGGFGFADCLKRGTCSVSLAGVPEPRLLIDLDLPGSPLDDQSVRCDYLVFAGDGQPLFLVVPIEFKTKWRTKVVKQLQAGGTRQRGMFPTASARDFDPSPRSTASGRRQHGENCVRAWPLEAAQSQSEWSCAGKILAACRGHERDRRRCQGARSSSGWRFRWARAIGAHVG